MNTVHMILTQNNSAVRPVKCWQSSGYGTTDKFNVKVFAGLYKSCLLR